MGGGAGAAVMAVLAGLWQTAMGSFRIDCEFGKPCRDICPSGHVVSDFAVTAKPWHSARNPGAYQFSLSCNPPPIPDPSASSPSSSSISSPHSSPLLQPLQLYRDISFEEARELSHKYAGHNEQARIPTQCEDSAHMDFIFLLDGSQSISRKHFEEEFIRGYRLSPRHTRVAVVEYGARARVAFSFTNVSQSFPALMKAVSSLRLSGGHTDITKALEAAERLIVEDALPRYRAMKAVVVVTEGRHSSGSRLGLPPTVPAARLRRSGVDVFAVRIGPKPLLTQLRALTASKERVFGARWDALSTAAPLISASVCSAVLQAN